VETLLVGITLGYIPRDEAGKQLRSEFTSGGVAHLLAVSGFHLAVVVGAMGYILSHLPGIRRRQRLGWAILLLCAWCFTLITGCAIPTVRAAAMLSLYCGARMLGRPASLPEIIALPALFQLLLNPMSILSASMPLTYLAILSIHLFYRPIYLSVGKIRSKLIWTLWGILALTLSVQPLLLPLSLYLFGYSSLSFLFTALPLTLLASLLIPTFLIVLLLLALGLSIAQPYLTLLEWATQMMHSLANAYSSLPFLQIHYTLTLPQLLLIYTLLVLGLIALRLHREKQKTW
jgi:ComEC/Rec2-like protein